MQFCNADHISPRHGHSSSPNLVRENSARASHHHSRKYDDREQGQQYGRNHYSRSSDSLRHSDRQSSKSSYGHSRHDKYANEDRYRERLFSRSGHESRDDHTREESDSKSKYHHSVNKYSRDKYDRSDHRSREKRRETYLEHQKYKDMDSSYDKSVSSKRLVHYGEVEKEGRSRDWDGRNERRDSRRSSGDYRSEQAVGYSDSRNQRDDSGPQRDSGKFNLKEAYKSEQESNDQSRPWEVKRKHDDPEIGKDKDSKTGNTGEQYSIEDKESSGKKLKLFDPDNNDNYRKDADESKTSNSKPSDESKADLQAAKTSGFDVDNDLDAAKIAAMRAAELVNRNLVGAGCLTTDQKKKLLWAGKRSTPTEESGHHGWDTAMFSDRERQEKFNKLMGMRGEAKGEQNSNQNSNDILRAEKQKEVQIDLEKQYTAGLRRRDGRTVGLGL
ncbi:hypothetical protein Fmac_025062 [Flemingia macrophylla]|uniref:Small acidic protein-like domain-containing protein n=1 Tax=Flemingia macrophylla TaxID=520843 RepID=A0ABD1LR49_9FABA